MFVWGELNKLADELQDEPVNPVRSTTQLKLLHWQ